MITTMLVVIALIQAGQWWTVHEHLQWVRWSLVKLTGQMEDMRRSESL